MDYANSLDGAARTLAWYNTSSFASSRAVRVLPRRTLPLDVFGNVFGRIRVIDQT